MFLGMCLVVKRKPSATKTVYFNFNLIDFGIKISRRGFFIIFLKKEDFVNKDKL